MGVFQLVVDALTQELRAECCSRQRDVVVRLRDAPLWLLDDSDDEDALVDRNLGLRSSSSTSGSTTVGDANSEQECFSDCDQEPESECDEEPEPDCEPEDEALAELPSVGSALHEVGL